MWFSEEIGQSFNKQGKFLNDKTEGHDADTGPHPGQKSPLIGQMIFDIRTFPRLLIFRRLIHYLSPTFKSVAGAGTRVPAATRPRA